MLRGFSLSALSFSHFDNHFEKISYLYSHTQTTKAMRIPKNFTAIDFETMTAEATSACAVGLVQVNNGVIMQEYYTLIKPIPDDREHTNEFVHGITPAMVENAPNFKKVFPIIAELIGDNTIVCHNRGADIPILESCMRHYRLSGIDTDKNLCTYELTGKSLVDACEEYNISMGCHHNALDDARACANVLLAHSGKIFADVFVMDKKSIAEKKFSQRVKRELLDQLDDSEIKNQNTVFFHSNLVITGTFDAYPDRNALAARLQALGADINTAISGKTTVVVMGQGAGPSKIKKIEDWIAKGHDIKIIRERELIEILENN